MAVIPVIKPSYTSLAMDQSDPLGNSTDVFARQALHVKVGNTATEPVPVYISNNNDGVLFSLFNEISSVGANTETTILTYIVPLTKNTKLERIEVDGTNIAKYKIKLNGSVIAQKHVWWTQGLNAVFDFSSEFERGVEFTTGQTITVTVEHYRPAVGSFSARLQGIEVDV